MSEFTKGPWLYSDAYHETQVDIRDNAGRRLAVVVTDPPLRNKTMEANAHLISAAPEMYEALKEMVFAYHNKDDNCPHEFELNGLKLASEAIAKAEGKS